MDTYEQGEKRIDHFMEPAKKYTDFTELTALMIKEFVEKIMAHAPERSTGKRTRQADIYFDHIGQFHIPDDPLSPEGQASREKPDAQCAE